MNRCYFCQNKTQPDFFDTLTLEKFLTLRNKIVSKDKSRVCTRHQRQLAKQIKYARYMALIPYTSYQSDKFDLNRG